MKINTVDKIFKWLYIVFLTALIIYVAYFTIVLVLSPKNDLKNRGFVACTKELVMNLGECKSGQFACVLGSFYDDTECNSAVIFKGFANWLKGKQPAPWSNYIFEPMLIDNSENPYAGNPAEDMETMQLEHDFMQQKLDELEAIKNRSLQTDESVIISDPEVDTELKIELQEPENETDFEQNIDDESAIGELNNGDESLRKIEQLPEKKIKSNSEEIAKRAKKEVLKEENKDE